MISELFWQNSRVSRVPAARLFLLRNLASQRLCLASSGFAVESSLFRTFGRRGRPSYLARDSRTADQRLQPFESVLPVFLLGAKLLCLDDDHAVFADAPVTQVQQALFVEIGKR